MGTRKQSSATRNVANVPAETATETAANLIPEGDSAQLIAELNAKLAERDAKIEALSAGKTRAPRARKVVTLEDVVARQAANPKKWDILGIASQVVERVAIGQDQEEALAQVLAQHGTEVTKFLAFYAAQKAENSSTTLMVSCWDFVKQEYSQEAPKSGHLFTKKASNGATASESGSSEPEQSALLDAVN